MYKLYYSSGTCSMAVHVVLNELVAPFELVDTSLKEGKNREPEFLKINPRGSVPVLSDDGMIVREGGAILVYLLDKHKSPLLPQSGAERAQALEWLMTANATMHPLYGRVFWAKKAIADKAAQEEIISKTREAIVKLWQEIDGQLAKQPYVAGKHITAADILLTVIAGWSGVFENPIPFGENVTRLFNEVVSRPSYQKALATEGVEFKLAA